MDYFLNSWISSVLSSETWSLQYFNLRIEVHTPARIRPYPTGRFLGMVMSQALRARLRSHGPSRTKAIRPSGLENCRRDDPKDGGSLDENSGRIDLWQIQDKAKPESRAERGLTAVPPFGQAC